MRKPLNPRIAPALAAAALLFGAVACGASGQIVPQTGARTIESGRALPGPLPTPPANPGVPVHTVAPVHPSPTPAPPLEGSP